jgi:acetyl-CoA synthetase
MITPLPGAIPTKPGTATLPFFGVDVGIVDEGQGSRPQRTGHCSSSRSPGRPCCAASGATRNATRKPTGREFKGWYFAGDGARRDKDGYIWIIGRIDDVLNVAGHRLGTAEVESALVSHPSVAEAAVVGRPDELKGQGVVCFVTVKEGIKTSRELGEELKKHVRKVICASPRPCRPRRHAG